MSWPSTRPRQLLRPFPSQKKESSSGRRRPRGGGSNRYQNPLRFKSPLKRRFRVQRFQDADFFKAKLIKSFDLNPTHPGPASKRQLPHAAARLNKPSAKKRARRAPQRSYVRQAATNEAADKPRSTANKKKQLLARRQKRKTNQRKFVRKQRERALIQRQLLWLPASSLLLLAGRLKRISRVAARLQSYERIRAMFSPGGDRGAKTTPAARNRRRPRRTSARQGGTEPGTTRFRDGRETTGPPKLRRAPARPQPTRGQEAPT